MKSGLSRHHAPGNVPRLRPSFPFFCTRVCFPALFSFWLLLTPGVAQASADKDTYGSAILDSVTSIYDGDTFRGTIKGYPPIIGHRISIRIYGIDTPELTDKRGPVKQLARRAKQYTVKRLREGKEIRLENMRRDKYFRILAEVIVDGSSLAEELVGAGLAKRYTGGTKPRR